MTLDEQARAARNAYYREWRMKNPDKVKKAMDRYWQKKALTQNRSEPQEDK
jgi:hypothetical protein